MTISAPTASDTGRKEPLSAAMKRGSMIEHDDAEHSPFMENLLAGKIGKEGYVAYLQRLRRVYAALESTGAEMTRDVHARKVLDPALDRLPSIDADLSIWAPFQPREADSPAAEAYAARIAASREWGGLYVAHHYTRYLGDLSGGQAVGRIVDRTFDLDGIGLDFYDFARIPSNKPYKDYYRSQLDLIGEQLTPAERDRIVDEVKVAFKLNHELFTELSRQLAG